MGFGTIRRLANLPQETKKRLTGLGCESLQFAEFRGTYIPEVSGHRKRGLDLREGTPRGIQEPAIIASAFSSRTLGEVQRNAVGCPAKLIREPFLLVVRKALRGFRALDRESFGVLPGF